MNKLEALQELLRRGVNLHRQVGEGGTALMRAGTFLAQHPNIAQPML
jgi:hypothetical protein